MALLALAIAALALVVAGARWTDDGDRSAAEGADGAGLARRVPVERAAAGEPRPLEGAPIRGRTGLHLVVAERRLFMLDVDDNSIAYLRGLPTGRRGVVSVLSVGGRGAAIVLKTSAAGRIYGLSSPTASPLDLGPGRSVAADGARGAVWILHRARTGRCTIRGVTLGGRATSRRQAFPCAATIAAGGPGKVVVNRTVVYDPKTARVVLKARAGVITAAGATLVLAGPGRAFTLVDTRTKRRQRLRWPSALSSADAPADDPRGRFVALGFANASWAGTGKQVLDVWLLDTRTRKLTQLPGMPAFVSLKATSMNWTDDGRLVLLARSAGRDVVATWRPGDARLALKNVRLRRPTLASDSFGILR